MPVKTVKTQWRELALVCRKCSRKADGGFGRHGKHSLAKALRKKLGAGGGRKAQIAVKEVDCFGVCPKNAVVGVNAARPGVLVILPLGMPTAEAGAALGLAREPGGAVSGDGETVDGVTQAAHESRPVG